MNRPSGDAAQQFMPLGDALRLAERYRGEGRLMEAETICRRLLEAQPNLPDVEHVLGLIAHQNGKLGEAIEHVQRATKLAPQVALFQANLGEMYRLAGRPKLAVEAASPFGWDRYADDVVGIDHFGASAPGPTVLAEFGFTPENVAARARTLLARGN